MSATLTVEVVLPAIAALRGANASEIDEILTQLSETSLSASVIAECAKAVITAARTHSQDGAPTTPTTSSLPNDSAMDDDGALAIMLKNTTITDFTDAPSPSRLHISVSGLGNELAFIVKPEYKLSRLLDAYCDIKGVWFEECYWEHGRLGIPIERRDYSKTFAQLGFVDGDVLEVTEAEDAGSE